MNDLNMGGYPLGASNDPRAPWNEKEPEKVKVKVCVSVTYSNLFEVEVKEEYDREALISAVKNMDILPEDVIKVQCKRIDDIIAASTSLDKEGKERLLKKKGVLKSWHQDELEVIDYDNHPQPIYWQ